jgi:hypothetical protein
VKSYISELLTDDSEFSFDAAVQLFYFEVVLANFEHGEQIPFLSRHAILHGADVGYGTKSNSLRTILLFDYVQSNLGVVAIGKGGCYHLPFCSSVRRTKTNGTRGELRFFQHENKAKAVRLYACKRCIR